ncbi:hypothetical protein MKW98_005605 [Papaver atlanticum]|uniref:Uncharacterized protein n=1 Tax=Papaver atlanticum TaxID=357466 RepID=A0AAD4STE5_9MAGN|nr:hypothetical protein MKW98_005605 [Papaver atlanticum]
MNSTFRYRSCFAVKVTERSRRSRVRVTQQSRSSSRSRSRSQVRRSLSPVRRRLYRSARVTRRSRSPSRSWSPVRRRRSRSQSRCDSPVRVTRPSRFRSWSSRSWTPPVKRRCYRSPSRSRSPVRVTRRSRSPSRFPVRKWRSRSPIRRWRPPSRSPIRRWRPRSWSPVRSRSRSSSSSSSRSRSSSSSTSSSSSRSRYSSSSSSRSSYRSSSSYRYGSPSRSLSPVRVTRRPRSWSRSPSRSVSRSPSRSYSPVRVTQPHSLSPVRGLRENGSATFLSSGNPLLDFFFHVVPDTPHKSMTQRLELAWKHDPLTALKLICNLRGVRGTGKSIKEGFYAAALWLHKNHPKTLASNLKAISGFGYFKDLPEILYRLHEGVDIREVQKREWMTEKHNYYPVKNQNGKRVHAHQKCKRNPKLRKTKPGSKLDEPKKSRKEKAIELSKRALERYGEDTEYRILHDAVSDLFAEFLTSDLKYLSSGELGKITLASKWCPSLNSCFDRATLLCESIARRIFPRNSNPEYENIEEAQYAYRVRDRLRREYLVPLRKVLELPEVYMSSKNWESLPYNRVSSVAMKKYKTFFEENDKERFNEYLESVKKGDTKIAAGALLPHEILASLDDEKNEGDCNVAELQWQRMVDDMSKMGKLNDCLAICDVSGSMAGTPMEVCVALGLLISDMSQEPWKGKLITFSSKPQLRKIEGENLRSKIKSIKKMDWEMSTDFQKVFDQILQVAVDGNLKEDQMIKRLFVFSDMEFDEASRKNYDTTDSDSDSKGNDWETDYQVIEKKFRKKGYMKVPEIVFWNLRDSSSTPVVAQQKGVALVSGYSKNMVTLFLEGSDFSEFTPIRVMEKAISGEEYNKLVVVD